MVYSPELGYDPEEWEECPEPDHFLVLSWFTRVCLSVGTVVASALFFWALEAAKKRNHRREKAEEEEKAKEEKKMKKEEEEEETVEAKFARASALAAEKAQPERRRNSKRELTREEEEAVLEWEAEVRRVAEARLRASREPEEREAEGEAEEFDKFAEKRAEGSKIGMEVEDVQEGERQQVEDVQEKEERIEDEGKWQFGAEQQGEEPKLEVQAEVPPVSGGPDRMDYEEWVRKTFGQEEIAGQEQQQIVQKEPEAKSVELLVSAAEQAKAKQLVRLQADILPPGATPPSTPPGGIALPELAAHYRQMADELTRKLMTELDEMEPEEAADAPRMAAQLQHRHRDAIEGGLQGTGAPQEIRQRLARQLESHVAEVVTRQLRKKSRGGAEDEQAEVPRAEKKGSSGESSDEGFVKVRAPTEEAPSPAGTALRSAETLTKTSESPTAVAAQHGMTPSPQLGGPATEEQDEQVRISVFEGDGGSTTADEIEFLGTRGTSPPEKSPEEAKPEPKQQKQQQRAPLGADETEQVMALLQEYDLSAGEVAVAGDHRGQEEEAEERRRRQISSGAASSANGGGAAISWPASAQRTPAGSSVPESPDSAAFDFVNFPEAEESRQASNVQRKEELQRHKAMPAAEERNIEVKHFEVPTEQPQRIAADAKSVPQGSVTPEQQQRTISRGKAGSVRSGGSGQSAFVVEEEMLESVEEAERKAEGGEQYPERKEEEGEQYPERKEEEGEQYPEHQQQLKAPPDAAGGAVSPMSTAATSRQIRTIDAFDKPEAAAALLFEDVDDKDVTYAPDIQSMEVPPDQLSQADSLNLVDDEQFSEGADEEEKRMGRKKPKEEERKGPDEEAEAEGAEEPGQRRELTPQEEEQLQRDIDRLRRTPSPRAGPKPAQPQVPQAPQFLRSYFNDESTSSLSSTSMRQSSLLSALGVTSTQEMLLRLTSLEALSEAMRRAGLESSNLIFGIDYTASNKYQGERSFGGRSLHSIGADLDNPYQQVIKIMGRTLAPFASHEHGIPVFGFGDSTTGHWSVFPLNGEPEGECTDLEEVLRVYNRVTPSVELSGPTNFAPLIYRAMEICHKRSDYHILVIIADGQVTNEKATVKAIVGACQYPLSIIVVGVGDGPWDMMRTFDESLPKRPWDNFHFVEFHELVNRQHADESAEQRELAFAVHSLLEISDQYATIRKLGMLTPAYYARPQPHSPRSRSPKLVLHRDEETGEK